MRGSLLLCHFKGIWWASWALIWSTIWLIILLWFRRSSYTFLYEETSWGEIWMVKHPSKGIVGKTGYEIDDCSPFESGSSDRSPSSDGFPNTGREKTLQTVFCKPHGETWTGNLPAKVVFGRQQNSKYLKSILLWESCDTLETMSRTIECLPAGCLISELGAATLELDLTHNRAS